MAAPRATSITGEAELQKLIERDLQVLAKIGNLGPNLEDGFLRAAWSDEETAAMRYFVEQAERLGLSSEFDAVGNLFIRTPPEFSPGGEEVIQIGSHLDTVPRGGLFDGGAGIVAGFQAIAALYRAGRKSRRALELVIWRGEESATFNAVFMGSTSAFGQAAAKLLGNEFGGRTLEQAMISQGCDPGVVRRGEATISRQQIDRISYHLELHIEQARKLEIDGLDIGIVTSIRAPRRFRVEARGESAHSGATPMGLPYRRDTVLAISHMLVRLDAAIGEAIAGGGDLVQTVGVLNADRDFNLRRPELYENAMTKVSAYSYFLLDIRGNRKKSLDSYTARAQEIIRETAAEFGVEVEIEHLAGGEPVEELDSELQARLSAISKSLGYRCALVPSGAGHDAAIVAKQRRSDGRTIPTAMLFIPCRNGISHHPLEFSTTESIARGAMVITQLLASDCFADGLTANC